MASSSGRVVALACTRCESNRHSVSLITPINDQPIDEMLKRGELHDGTMVGNNSLRAWRRVLFLKGRPRRFEWPKTEREDTGTLSAKDISGPVGTRAVRGKGGATAELHGLAWMRGEFPAAFSLAVATCKACLKELGG